MDHLESRELLTGGGPSADAQYMLELINLARTNPSAAADLVTNNLDPNVMATVNYYHVDLNAVKNDIANSSPRPPLAWNDNLAESAINHSLDMANNGFQSHTGSNGSTVEQRDEQAGYNNHSATGENAYAYSTSVDQAMDAFLIDWGVDSHGHRNNLLQPNASPDQFYREVGIGIISSNVPNFGPKVITQDFGSQNGAKAELLGVAYNDPNHTHRYAQGSGVGNVEIDATNVATGQTQSTQTWDSGGGYQIPLDPGTYNVVAKVGNQTVRSDQVNIGTQNVKVDYDLSDPWQGGSSISQSPVQAASQTMAQQNTLANGSANTGALSAPSSSPRSSSSWLSLGSWNTWTARRSG
jgi:uncharacterized protein YkwD